MLAEAAETVTVPDAASAPEEALLPVNVWVPARNARSAEVFGRVKLRVVPVLIPANEKVAFFVGSASLTRLNTASDTSRGSPTTSQAVPVQTSNSPSSSTHARQPFCGGRRSQAPSVQRAMFRS